MTKNSFFLSLILTFVASTLATLHAQDAKAKTVLDAVKVKYEAMASFQANFLCVMSSPSTGVNETYKGEITVKGSKFYLKLPKQDVITDGKTQWTFMRDANEVNITNYEPDPNEVTPDKIYTLYESNYAYVYVEEKVENGKAFHLIDLKPKNRDAQFFKIRLKITKNNGIKSWELFERNSNSYLYTIQKFATVSVNDSYFKYDKANYSTKPKEVDLR